MVRVPRTLALPATESATKERLAPRWNVVLLDDDQHSYAYVIEMLGALFGYGQARAFLLAEQVDRSGRALLWCGPLEVAEFKQERIHGYGADPRIPSCRGSMSAVLEPVE
ncbi:MAG: ATP-dependent Clp protease adaptor ClpS [Planctomycetes bacterium]|nr:ATP-dependent Clp protease adaptor ClpS [Planctomycetota bacterium]